MAYLKIPILLAIKLEGEVPEGLKPAQLLTYLPKEVADHLPDFVREVRRIKKYSTKINTGQPNEEITVTARWHVCRHDEGRQCEAEKDI